MAADGKDGVIVKRGSGYGVSVYDAALKRKRWVGTFASSAPRQNAGARRRVALRLSGLSL